MAQRRDWRRAGIKEAHAAQLEASGISLEIAQQRGIKTVTESAMLHHVGFKISQDHVPGILIPIWGVNGQRRSWQYRPDVPRKDNQGRERKYENPPNVPTYFDIHPSQQPRLEDTTVPLWVTEGIKKGDAAATVGLCCISLVGVWNWLQNKKPHPDWELVPLKERHVYICFDSDSRDKKGVKAAERALRRYLRTRGATPHVLRLPSDGVKVGLDDYLAAGHTADDLLQLVDQSDERPTIDTADAGLEQKTDLALTALVEMDTGYPIYQRERVLVEHVQASEFEAINPHRMQRLLSLAATWEGKFGRVDPPMAVVNSTLNAWDALPFPKLERVIHSPVFNADGSLHVTPGYDDKTGTLYLAPKGLTRFPVPSIPERPTKKDLAQAKGYLDELLVDFCFEEPSDTTHAVGLLLEPFARALISDVTPMHGITAPSPGSGKGKLKRVCLIPALGPDEAAVSFSDITSDSEMRKKLTGACLSAQQVFSIDNVNYTMSYSSLASALTEGWHQDRVLGVSRNIRFKIPWVWVATGNNLKGNEEFVRRLPLIKLDPKMERPYLRTGFRHKLPEWAVQSRHLLIWSACTIIRYWLANGSPAPASEVPAFGSFEEWREVMGGILHAAGYEGFLAGMATTTKRTAEQEVFAAFMRQVYDKHGAEPWGVKEVADLEAAAEVVPDADPWSAAFKTRLGKYLESKDKVTVGNQRRRFQLQRQLMRSRSGAVQYCLVEVSPQHA